MNADFLQEFLVTNFTKILTLIIIITFFVVAHILLKRVVGRLRSRYGHMSRLIDPLHLLLYRIILIMTLYACFSLIWVHPLLTTLFTLWGVWVVFMALWHISGEGLDYVAETYVYNKVESDWAGPFQFRIIKGVVRLLLILIGLESFSKVLGMEINLTPLWGAMGVLSLAIAFAGSKFLEYIFNGFIVSSRYTAEHQLTIEGIGYGRLKWIGWIHSNLERPNGNIISIPNTEIISRPVIKHGENETHGMLTIIEVEDVHGSYEQVEKLIVEALRNADWLAPDKPILVTSTRTQGNDALFEVRTPIPDRSQQIVAMGKAYRIIYQKLSDEGYAVGSRDNLGMMFQNPVPKN